MMSENVWCFVSYNMFSQDTLLYSAAESAQNLSAMQRKCNFVALAVELWRGTGKKQRAFGTRERRLRDRGGAWWSLLPLFLYLQLLHVDISVLLCKGSFPLHYIKQLHFTHLWFFYRSRREGGKSRAWREVETHLNAASASRGKLKRRWDFSGKRPSQTPREGSCKP